MPRYSIITTKGKAEMLRLLKGDGGDALVTHCAVGTGDGSFSDPLDPPAPTADQETLVNEVARRTPYKVKFLEASDSTNAIIVSGGTYYTESDTSSNVLGFFFRFEDELENQTLKEYGFFGRGVTFKSGVDPNLAENGIYDASSNPTGEVDASGTAWEIVNIPDDLREPGTLLELVAILKS